LKIAFDALYGISHENIATHNLIELIAYLYYDGKISQGSKFEVQMSETVIDHFKNDTKISRRNLALCWIFCKAYAREPAGASIEVKRFVSLLAFKVLHSSACILAFIVEERFVEIRSS